MAAEDVFPVDSLLKVYEKVQGNEKKDIAKKIISFCLKDEKLPNSVKEQTNEFMVCYAAEFYFMAVGNFEEALTYIDRAFGIGTKNSLLHATLLCDRGYCFYKQGRLNDAVDAEIKASEYAKKHQLWQPLARSYNYLAIVNISLGNIEEAERYVEKAIKTDQLSGSHENTHNYLGIACEVYAVAKDTEKALYYGKKAVEEARAIGYEAAVVNHLSQLSYVYNRVGDYAQGLKTAEEALAEVEKMPVVDKNLLAISLEYMVFNLLDMKRNAEAVPQILRAIKIQEEIGNKRSVCYDYKTLAEALEPDDPRGALKALRQYSSMMDSIHNAEMHAVLGQANAEFHNEELQEENERGRRLNRLVIIIAVIGALLLLTIIASLYYVNRLRTRTLQATKRLQKDRETFYTNITHEFRTPLTVILGLAGKLKQSLAMGKSEQNDKEWTEGLSLIEHNGGQLLNLVNQLLDISKITKSTGLPEYQYGNIVAYLNMLAESFRQTAEMKGIDIKFESAEQEVMTDFVPDYVQKIIGNLLFNSLKFTSEGGTIVLKSHKKDKQIVMSVSDTGCGITPEDLPHIFEPFYRGHNHAGTGTGVGLALVQELVKVLGGKISVDSTLGQGTTFTITMPLKEMSLSQRSKPVDMTVMQETSNLMEDQSVETGEQQPALPVRAKGDDDNSAESPQLILVVEDNRDVAYYIGSILVDQYDVVYAQNGAEGVAKARELTPDLIITDVMMPDVDGLELCRQLRVSDLTNHIPIIIITALATDTDRLLGIGAGADAYLTKPFREEELKLRVIKLLQQRHILQKKFGSLISNSEIVTDKEGDTSQETETVNVYEQNVEKANQKFLERLDNVILQQMQNGDLDTSVVAEQLNMSRSQLGRKLKAVIDMTPAAYILDIRLNEVKHLLTSNPELTYLDVALRCGFADNSHMTHTFRRKFGMTPSQFVKQYKSKE